METHKNEQAGKTPEANKDLKPGKAPTQSKSSNRRLSQAIDIILDYIIENEESSPSETGREQILILSAHQTVPEAVFEAYATSGQEKRENRIPKPSGVIY